MTTTKFKLNWLKKNEQKYKIKLSDAYTQVRDELVSFIRDVPDADDVLIRYLAKVVETDSIFTFTQMIKGALNDAKKCKGDLEAIRAIWIFRYILFRLDLLSNFTTKWTNIELRCPKCHRKQKLNFLYTDKLCKYCSSILFKGDQNE